MKSKTILISIAILVFTSAGISQTTTVSPNQTAVEAQNAELRNATVNLTQLQKQYNKNSEEIPSFVGTIIGDQVITVNLTQLETGSQMLEEDIIGVKTNGVRTQDIRWGEYEEPTLKVWITQENVEALNNADNPGEKLNQMMKNDKIKYETYTFGNSLMFGALELLSSLA